MNLRRTAIGALAVLAVIAGSLTAAPAQAQYGGTKLDCYINILTGPPSPWKKNVWKTVIAKGGNKGTRPGNCHVSARIKRFNLIGQNTGDFDIWLPVGGKFTTSFDVKPTAAGNNWQIRVCAVGRYAISINPGDDCKFIYRNVIN